MNGVYSLSTTFAVLIVIGEILRQNKFKDIDPIAFHWIFLGLFLFYYEGTVVLNRKDIKKEIGKDFWNKNYTPFSKKVLVDSFAEYALETDARYFNPKSTVYLYESANAIISLIMGVLLLMRKERKVIIGLLIAQIIVCCLYFLTIQQNPVANLKSGIYAFISFLWILIPVIIIMQKRL